MSIFSRFFKKQSEGKDQKASAPQQAVFVYLKGTGLPDSVYQDYDLATLEDQLIEVIEQNDLGEFDGNEFGPEETTLYMYGPDAEKLFVNIEKTLRDYPLCQNARVIIRYGDSEADQREVEL
tara:strand:+ start:90 stop:455 length:366 start_codon:yes stop_codon:yes gene_type:complete